MTPASDTARGRRRCCGPRPSGRARDGRARRPGDHHAHVGDRGPTRGSADSGCTVRHQWWPVAQLLRRRGPDGGPRAGHRPYGPLAGSWDSGASAWSPAERQAYANDLGDQRTLAAVTARENRSKADQDPAEWLPSDAGAVCRYVTEWTAVKARWGLSADRAEVDALEQLADGCPDTEITVVLAR
ncbi:HNH endonuclease family protein [Streptomyces sp. NPDC048636]|uniref:HNH endonuclease family protein n=1 Tax=Streptomyces sp. NPDC048636 TaxID=3155762 RepID=UPI00341A93CD